MAKIKGQAEYQKFLDGKPLTRKQAMLAQCYACNGEEESAVDCQGHSCPLYQFHHHRIKRKNKMASLPSPGEVIENRSLSAHKTAAFSTTPGAVVNVGAV